MQVFAERLNECGVRYMRQPLPPGSGPAADTRANLIIELGPQPSALMWVGHVDTDAMNKPAIKLFRKHDFLHEDLHVYLSKNLTSHPDYRRLRKKKQAAGRKRKDSE